jgi:hypothetical protein
MGAHRRSFIHISTIFTADEKTTSFVIFEKATKSFGTSILPRESISTTAAVNLRIKSLFFLHKRFSLLIFCIIKFQMVGYNSNKAEKQNASRQNRLEETSSFGAQVIIPCL